MSQSPPPSPPRHHLNPNPNPNNLHFDFIIDNLDDPTPLSFVFTPNYSESEPDSDPPDPFFFFAEDEDEDEEEEEEEEENSNFVSDFLDSFPRENQEDGEGDENEIEIDLFGELGLGSGLGFRLGNEFAAIDGLRVVDSDSGTGMDTGSVELEFGIEDENENEFDGSDYGVGDDHDWPVIWDCMRFDNPRAINEEFEWEEVDERDNLNLGSLIDRIEEISVSSGISTEENGGFEDGDEGEGEGEETRNLEWEVLLAVNNFDRNLEFDGEGDDGNDGVTYLAVQDDYMYTVE